MQPDAPKTEVVPVDFWCPVGPTGALLVTLSSYTHDGAEANAQRVMEQPWDELAQEGFRIAAIRAEEILL